MEKTWLYGYAMLPCFKVRTLEDGSGAEMLCGDFMQWVFGTFFYPFWNGKIHVTEMIVEGIE